MSEIINAFPGYEFVYDPTDKKYHNMYRGEDVGMGGYVYVEEGMYGNVALLDVASMHPHSIIAMNYFGEYTGRYKELMDVRIAIKHGDYDAARKMFDGKLAPYLTDESSAKALSNAFKLPINGSYGLTAAKFDNAMRDPRNKNNIVACRGALFMVNLKHEVQKRGYKVVHIKTDSIKIADADPEIVKFVCEYGKQYFYNFEFEAFYEKLCIVNKSTYIAKVATPEQCMKYVGEVPGDNAKKAGTWTSTADQFSVPYVFKTLFSKEKVEFEDLCETKSVKGALYLDMNESLLDVSQYEKELQKNESKYKKGQLSDVLFENECSKLNDLIAEGHDYQFIGKVGNFCPIKAGCGGGLLMRYQDGKYNAAESSTGYRWLESEMVKELGREDDIDMSYFTKLVDAAVDTISQYGDFEWFASDDPYIPKPKLEDFMNIPETDLDEVEFPFT